MSTPVWIGILGTIVMLAFFLNGLRLIRGPKGHAANAGKLHMATAAITLPILWMVIAVSAT